MSQQRAGNNHLIPFIWLDYKFFQVTAILNRKLAPISGRQHVCTAVVRSWRCGSFPDTSINAVYLVRQLMLTMTATPANMQMTSVHLFLHGNHTNSSYLSLLQRIQNIHKVTSLQHPNGTLELWNTKTPHQSLFEVQISSHAFLCFILFLIRMQMLFEDSNGEAVDRTTTKQRLLPSNMDGCNTLLASEERQ